MGLLAPLKQVFSFTYKTKLDNDLYEHELDHVFVGVSDNKPVINQEEVASYRYVSTERLAQEIKKTPELFTVWFKILFNRVIQENIL